MIRRFDALPDGREVHAINLAGPRLRATVLTLGVTLQDLRLRDVAHPLVLSFPDVQAYLSHALYAGAIVGRFANRIGQARFVLDGVTHHVDPNFKDRHLLHGGHDGTHRHLWRIEDVGTDFAALSLDLPDGHMGFPGRIHLRATVGVSADALTFDLRATSDAPTPCNLAHHGYFNLDGGEDVRRHHLQVAADHYLPVDDDQIPTGQILPVEETPFDFRDMRQIGDSGYDHNLCLARRRREMRRVAVLRGQSGLTMQIHTTEPGVQVYDGGKLQDVQGTDGRVYGPYAGMALETQGWPDALNHPQFPDCILRPGQEYRAMTAYRFQS